MVPGLGPLFSLIRAGASCAWAVRWDVRRDVTDEVNGMAEEEPPVADSRQAPVHAQRSVEVTSANIQGCRRQAWFASDRRRPGRYGGHD